MVHCLIRIRNGRWCMASTKRFWYQYGQKRNLLVMKKYSTSYLINESNLNKEFNELFHRYEKESTEVSVHFQKRNKYWKC